MRQQLYGNLYVEGCNVRINIRRLFKAIHVKLCTHYSDINLQRYSASTITRVNDQFVWAKITHVHTCACIHM